MGKARLNKKVEIVLDNKTYCSPYLTAMFFPLLSAVTLLGQVKRQLKHTRNSNLATYKVQVKRILHGSDNDEMSEGNSQQHLRTVVFASDQPLEIEGGRRKPLHIDTEYIFQGKLIDDALFVSRQNILRHSTELENQVMSC